MAKKEEVSDPICENGIHHKQVKTQWQIRLSSLRHPYHYPVSGIIFKVIFSPGC